MDQEKSPMTEGNLSKGGGGTVGGLAGGSQSYDTTGARGAQEPIFDTVNPDELARLTIRKLLDGAPPNGIDVSQCGPWAGAVTELVNTWQDTGAPGVRAAWPYLVKQDPHLARLVASDGPLAGATQTIRRLCKLTDKIDLPSIDDARALSDLAGLTDTLMTAPKVNNRDRKRGVAFAIRRLLTVETRLILDVATETPYVIDDARAIWPLSPTGDVLPVQAMLSEAGLNVSEPAFRWLVDDLRTWSYKHGERVTLERFWARRPGILYLSCGPHRLVKATVSGLQVLPNGTDGIHFAADTVLPEWQPRGAGLSPLELAAFRPNTKTPEDVPGYTPDVQRLLLAAWLVALVAGIRPLPLLAAIGDRDGGKTRLVTAVSQIIMCSKPTTASEDQRDLWALAVQTPVLALDNVDGPAADWLPDFLAALVTGVNYQRRRLFTNADIDGRAALAVPALSTRTAAFARPDVAQRTLPILTHAFEDRNRQADSDLENETAAQRDEVLTWLAHKAILMLERIDASKGKIPVLPGRFVDFARVVWAFDEGRAYAALDALQQAQSMTVGNADALLSAVLEYADALLGESGQWRGKAVELTNKLTEQGADLPHFGGGKEIGRHLREGKSTLALFGLELTIQGAGGGHTYFILARSKQ